MLKYQLISFNLYLMCSEEITISINLKFIRSHDSENENKRGTRDSL